MNKRTMAILLALAALAVLPAAALASQATDQFAAFNLPVHGNPDRHPYPAVRFAGDVGPLASASVFYHSPSGEPVLVTLGDLVNEAASSQGTAPLALPKLADFAAAGEDMPSAFPANLANVSLARILDVNDLVKNPPKVEKEKDDEPPAALPVEAAMDELFPMN